MFDSLPGRRQMYERYLLGLDEAGELDDWDDRYYREEIDDDDEDEWPLARMARLADDIEAGRAEVPRRWKLERPSPGILPVVRWLWVHRAFQQCRKSLTPSS